MIRPMVDSDLAFIYSSFIRSWLTGNLLSLCSSPAVQPMPMTTLWDDVLLPQVLSSCNTLVHEDSDVILGYTIFRPGLIFFTYTKELYRRSGVAAGLFEASMGLLPPSKITVVCSSRSGDKYLACMAKRNSCSFVKEPNLTYLGLIEKVEVLHG